MLELGINLFLWCMALWGFMAAGYFVYAAIEITIGGIAWVVKFMRDR